MTPHTANLRSRAEALADLINWHHPSILTALGAVLLSVATLPQSKHHVVALIVSGGAFTLLGLVLAAKNSTTALALQANLDATRATNERLLQEAKNRSSTRLFLITADLSDVEWQVRFVRRLLYAVRQQEFTIDVFVPKNGFDSIEQDSHMNVVKRNKRNYAGGILISMMPEHRREAVEGFAAFLDLPLVVVDNVEHPAISSTAYVGVKSKDTGRLAGEAAIDLARRRNISRVLVIAAEDQVDRQVEFKKTLRDYEDTLPGKMSKIEIRIRKDGGFSRSNARVITMEEISTGIRNKDSYQLIFCTSDAMTLGCLDSLNELAVRIPPTDLPLVIGHDGFQTVLDLLDARAPFLARVVVTDPFKMAAEAVEMLYSLLDGKTGIGPKWSTPYLEPPIYQDDFF